MSSRRTLLTAAGAAVAAPLLTACALALAACDKKPADPPHLPSVPAVPKPSVPAVPKPSAPAAPLPGAQPASVGS